VVTVVATWDARTAEARIHLSLDSHLFDTASRVAMAQAKVEELEQLYSDQPVEVVMASARSLDEFRKTDPRFYGV
jgi:hypothetical protein